MSGFQESRMLSLEDSLQRSLLTKRTLNLSEAQTSLYPEEVLNLQIKTLVGDLEGHSGPITSLLLTPDGSSLISGSSDKTVIIWSTLHKKPVSVLPSHQDEITDLCLSSDSSLLLSASKDKTAKLWNFQSRSLLVTLSGHNSSVTSATFSETLQNILTCSEDCWLFVWTRSGSLLKQLFCGLPCKTCAAIKDLAVVACQTGNYLIWNIVSFDAIEKTSMQGEVNSLAASYDQDMMACASSGGKVSIWKGETLEVLWEFQDRKGLIGVRFSGNSRFLLTCSDDYYIYVWDVLRRQREVSLRFFPKKPVVFCVDFDFKLVVAGFNDKSLRIWESCERKDVKTLNLHHDEVRTLALSRDESLLATGSFDKSLKVINLKDFQQEVFIREKFYSNARCLAGFNRLLLSAHEDGSLLIWDLMTQCKVKGAKSHSDRITALTVSQELKLAATASRDKTIVILDLEQMQERCRINIGDSQVNGLVFVNQSRRLVSAGEDGLVNIWDFNGSLLSTVTGHESAISDLSVTPNSSCIASAGKDGFIRVWNLLTLKNEFSISFDEPLTCVVFCMRSDDLFCALSSGLIKCYNSIQKKKEFSLTAHQGPINSMVLTKIEDKLITCGSDKKVIIWRLSSNQLESILTGHSLSINDMILIGDLVLTCSEDSSIIKWSLSENSQKSCFQYKLGKILCVSFSPNKKFLTFGTDSSELNIYDLSKKSLIQLSGHSGSINSIGISPDNEKIVSGSADSSIKVWSVFPAQKDFELSGHSEAVTSVLFTHKPSTLVSGSLDKTIKIWNIQTKRQVFSYQNNFPVNCMAVGLLRNLLYAGSEEKTVKVFSVKERKVLYSTPIADSQIASIAINNQESFLAYAGLSIIYLFDTASREVLFKLSGHARNLIHGLAFTSNNRLVSGSADFAVKIWECLQVSELHKVSLEDDLTLTMTATEDKEKLLCGLDSGEVKVWNIIDRSLYWSCHSHQEAVLTLKIIKNSDLFVTGSKDKTIKLWNIRRKRLLNTFEGHSGWVKDLLPHNQEFKFFSASFDGKIKIWNLELLEEEGELDGHSQPIECLHFFGGLLVSGSQDKSIVFWKDDKKQFELLGHSQAVISLDHMQNVLISGSADCSIKFWNPFERVLLNSFNNLPGRVSSLLVISEDLFLCGFSDSSLKLLNKTQEVLNFSSHNGKINSLVAISENLILSSSDDKTIRTWDIESGLESSLFKGRSGSISCLTASRHYLFIGNTDGGVSCINLAENREEAFFFAHSSIVRALAYFDDEEQLISCSNDFLIKFWDLRTKKLVDVKKEHSHRVRHLEILSNKQFLLSCSSDNSIILWNLRDRSLKLKLQGHKGFVNQLEASQDCSFLVSCSADLSIKYWRLETGQEIGSINNAHTDSILALVLLEDRWQVASSSRDKSIKLWDIDRKRHLFSFLGHKGSVERLIATQNRRFLISGSEDRTVKLWSLEEKRIEYTLPSHSGTITGLCLSFDKKSLFASSEAGELKEWRLACIESNEERVVDVLQSDFQVSCDSSKTSQMMKKLATLNENLSFFDNSPSHCLDVFINEASRFFNVCFSVKTGTCSKDLPGLSNVKISNCCFGLAHILAYTGKEELLAQLLSNDSLIFADSFGKSPFYYAFKSNHNRCAEILLDFLISLYEKDLKYELMTATYALRNDFSMILSRSVLRVGRFLKVSMVSSKSAFVSFKTRVPSAIFSSLPVPAGEDLETFSEEPEKIQIFFLSFPFELPLKPGSQASLDLLNAISQCQDQEILSSLPVQEFVNFQLGSVVVWVRLYSFLYFCNLILLLILCSESSLLVLTCFIVVNSLLLIFEVLQIATSPGEYFKDFWNIVDFFRLTLLGVWVFFIDSKVNYLEEVVIFLNFARGLTAFRIFDGTRYYIRLILKSLNDVKYFLIMFFYSNLMMGSLYSVRSENQVNFQSLWFDMYSFNFGYFDAQRVSTTADFAIFMFASVLNIIVMLNLLISILGDSHDQFQLERTAINYQEKTEMCLEIQRLMFWNRNQKDLGFMHLVRKVGQDKNDGSWEGRVLYIEKQIESINLNVKNSNQALLNEVSSKIDSSVTELKNHFDSDKFLTRPDAGKTVDDDSRFYDIHEMLDNRIKKIENFHESLLEKIKQSKFDLNEKDLTARIEDKIDSKLQLIVNRIETLETGILSLIEKLNHQIN